MLLMSLINSIGCEIRWHPLPLVGLSWLLCALMKIFFYSQRKKKMALAFTWCKAPVSNQNREKKNILPSCKSRSDPPKNLIGTWGQYTQIYFFFIIKLLIPLNNNGSYFQPFQALEEQLKNWYCYSRYLGRQLRPCWALSRIKFY